MFLYPQELRIRNIVYIRNRRLIAFAPFSIFNHETLKTFPRCAVGLLKHTKLPLNIALTALKQSFNCFVTCVPGSNSPRHCRKIRVPLYFVSCDEDFPFRIGEITLDSCLPFSIFTFDHVYWFSSTLSVLRRSLSSSGSHFISPPAFHLPNLSWFY